MNIEDELLEKWGYNKIQGTAMLNKCNQNKPFKSIFLIYRACSIWAMAEIKQELANGITQ